MKLHELRNKVITAALERHKGNAEKAAWDLKVSARSIYSFKSKQEQNRQKIEIDEFLNKNIKQ
jgi:transcriptional regulator with PAS, ATPase and Fis domain